MRQMEDFIKGEMETNEKHRKFKGNPYNKLLS